MATLEYIGPRSFRKQLQSYNPTDVEHNSHPVWEIAAADEGAFNEFIVGDHGTSDIYLPSGHWQTRARIIVDDKGDGAVEGFDYVSILSPGYVAVTQNIGPFTRVARMDRLTGLYATDENEVAAKILNSAIKIARPWTKPRTDHLFVAVTTIKDLSDGDVIRCGDENSPYLFRFRAGIN